MSRSAVRQALALERERMDPIAPTVATVPIAADALGAVDPEHAVTTAAAEDDNTAAGGDTEDIVIAEAIAEVEADAKAARAAAGGTVEEEGAVEAKATPALFDSAAAPPAPADATHAKADSDSDESSGSWVEVDSTAMDVALDVALDVEQTSPPAEAEPQEMPPPWESGDAPNPYPIEALYDAEVNMLVAMGFTETGARPALVRSKGDVTAAIEELLG
uniref:UBA domain-containing protein n=1 Tax=Phaeomonas parva TaxID=124430 RepID=A0A6U4DB67_9STRA